MRYGNEILRIISLERGYFHEMWIISTEYKYRHKNCIISTESEYFHEMMWILSQNADISMLISMTRTKERNISHSLNPYRYLLQSFCDVSETAHDVIASILQELHLPPQTFKDKMQGPTNASTYGWLNTATTSVNLTEVFVDDSISATNNTNWEHLTHLSCAMLHGINYISPPTEVSGNQGEDPIPQKKVIQGEVLWDTTKDILGWIVDGSNFIIQVMPEIYQKIAKLIKKVCKTKFCPYLT